MQSVTDNAIVARMLSYGLVALEVDLALTRVTVKSQMADADVLAIERAREVINFAREGEELSRTLKLTSNAVLAMRIYDSVVKAGNAQQKIVGSVLNEVDKLLSNFLAYPKNTPFDHTALEAATVLRDFFRFFRNDALGSCSGPIEIVKTIQHSHVSSTNLDSR